MNKIILKIQKLMVHKYTIQRNYNYELKSKDLSNTLHSSLSFH